MVRAMYPVEPPPARVEPALGRRRHRSLTAPAGVLLFLCIFLPMVRGCDDHTPIYPLELPVVLPPYVFGLAFAAAAAAVTSRGLRRAHAVLRVLAGATLAASVTMALVRPTLGALAVVASGVMLAAIGWRGASERRIALGAALLGATGTLWFGLGAASTEALSGVYAALVASAGLCIGGLVWLVEVTRGRRPGLSSGT